MSERFRHELDETVARWPSPEPVAALPPPAVASPAAAAPLHARVLQLQRTAGNHATAGALARMRRGAPPDQPLLQRLVHTIGKDTVSKNNERNLVVREEGMDDPGGSLRLAGDHQSEYPLRELGPDESLHVIGHGDGKGSIEGMDAEKFVDYLVGKGLTVGKHRGAIRLVSCFSATKTAGDRILSQEIVLELRKRGFDNPVISFDGLVRVSPGARVGTVAPENVEAYDKLMAVIGKIRRRIEAITTELVQAGMEMASSVEDAIADDGEPDDVAVGHLDEEDLKACEDELRELASIVDDVPDDGTTELAPDIVDKLSADLTTATTPMRVQRTRPTPKLSQRQMELQKRRKQLEDELSRLTALAEQKREQIETLFDPQRLGKNLRYVPQGQVEPRLE
jgi:hypothetical protein